MNRSHEKALGIRPSSAAILMLAFAASACSGAGVDETVLDEAVLDEAVLDAPDSAETSARYAWVTVRSEEDEPAPLSVRSEGLTGRSVANTLTVHTWKKGQPALTLQPVNSHLCALSMIRGHFDASTSFSLEPTYSGNWVLAGATQAAGNMEIEAVCMPKSTFLTNNGVAVHANNGNVGFNQTNYEWSAAMLSKTAPMLSHITGAFNGFGEKAWVVKVWGDPFIDGLFLKNGTATGWHIAKAHAVNFGRARVPTYTHTGFSKVEANTREWCNASLGGCPSLDDFCYITGIGGKLRGQGEWFRVKPDWQTHTWFVEANALANGRVEGEFHCLSRDQR